jgi:hypothetical protein
MAQQVLKLLEVLKQQGAYRVRFAEGGERLEWVTSEDGTDQVLTVEPDAKLWDRLMLELLAPLAPESLL